MMKRFIRWGVVLSLCATSSPVDAASPWGRDDSGLTGSFLSPTRYYSARRLQDSPQAPDVDAANLPGPDGAAAGSGVGDAAPSSSDALPQDALNADLPPSELAPHGSLGPYGCANGDCGDACAVGGPCGCSPWFGGLYGLVMTLDDNCGTNLSYESTFSTGAPLLSTNSADLTYGGGAEARIGRYLNNCWGVEAAYWGFFPDDESASVNAADYAGNLFTGLGYDGLNYNNGVIDAPVSNWYGTPTNSAQMHEISRSFQAHNIELNLIRNPYRGSDNIHFELLAGVRYLRLDDGLVFSTDYTSTTFGDDPANELHHEIGVQNDLVGFQIGGRADRYFCCRRLGLHIGSKLGIYNNRISHYQRIYGGNGNAYLTGSTDEYVIDNSDDDVAFVGELFAGASYCLCDSWRLTGGYRAVTATGVSLANSQIPRVGEFVNALCDCTLNSCDSLLLHGAYLGVEYNW
jgi:hypothetical protein